jgi:iron complex transport system ATP-binding protein
MTTPDSASSAIPSPGPRLTLHAENIHFSYGRQPVLRGLTLSFHAGALTAIVGPNGCGKSTFLHILLGHQKPDQGRVTLSDHGQTLELKTLSAAARARHLSFVPQTGSVGFSYTARQIVLMARWAQHRSRGIDTALGFETADDHALADTALTIMEAQSFADRPITDLSGGERQRVLIARALAQNTPIMLLDEPTSAFDLYHQIMLLEHLKKLAHEGGRLIVLVTHDLNLARQYADRVIVLSAGAVVADGPPETTLTPEILEPVYRVRVQPGAPDTLSFHQA